MHQTNNLQWSGKTHTRYYHTNGLKPLRGPETANCLAVLHRTSLTKSIAVSTQHFVFTAFEIHEVRLSQDGHTAVFLSVYHPPPSWQNKLTNAMLFAAVFKSFRCFLRWAFCGR